MRWVLVLFAGLVFFASAASGGPNAGGTLVVHAVDAVYTSDNTGYCGEPLPRTCELVDSRIDDSSTHVWLVLAVFTNANKPRMRGVEFGVSHSGVSILDWGTCADLDVSMAGWPQSNRGTILNWAENQVERIIPVYWFAGYTYGSAAAATFRVTPHPVNGGHFADDYIPSHLDEVAAYGVLGFSVDGVAACPAVRTFVVRPDGTGDRPTIQDAIWVAAPGSVIELDDGVYRGVGNRDIRTNDTPLTIRSISGNPEACVIDCEGTVLESHRAFVIYHHEAQTPVIEGIKIVGGYAGADFLYDADGGAVDQGVGSTLIMRNCIFEGCAAEHAGGAIETRGTLLLEDCVFRDNTCLDILGGAIFANNSELTLRRCRFERNQVDYAGGAIGATAAKLQAEACAFVDNDATLGGGVYIRNSLDARFSGCTWVGNSAFRGGAVYCFNTGVEVERCTVAENTATAGSAIDASEGASQIDLRNTILSFGSTGAVLTCGPSTVTADSCNVYGNAGGDWPSCLLDQSTTNGNFSADPLFCDRPARDFHLDATSPCAPGNAPGEGLVGAWPVGCGIATSIDEPAPILGVSPITPRAIPNPFRELTEIRYAVDGAGAQPVLGQIFDPSGRLVRGLVQGNRPAGVHHAQWDGRNDAGVLAPTGVYFFRLSVGERSEVARLLRIR